jgi:putative oxygen-independent coproporphyrinogen III oxidase
MQVPGELSFDSLPPLSLYMHLPWCLRKCPYCDFNSHERRDAVPEAAYVDALLADVEHSLPLVWGRRVHTVFIGGGTPSLFSPDAIDRLLAGVRARLPLEPGCEITLEANPGTFERERFRAFRAAGVTRLSIGVQSFDDAKLQALGRVHDAAQARAAIEEARACFGTWNLDLMYALPEQTLEQCLADVDEALALRPPHLSLYHLTLEPNTLFATRPPPLPDDDTAASMLDAIAARTQAAGYERYEVSAYAQPGHRCAHNLNYWRFGDYLGVGAGAHGKLTFAAPTPRVLRQVRWREPERYLREALAGNPVSNEHDVAHAELPFEFMLNALRLADGIELATFGERTGLPLATLARPLADAEARGLIERDAARVRPTARGFDFLSDLQALFLPPRRAARVAIAPARR